MIKLKNILKEGKETVQDIHVDGGVNNLNASDVIKAGANVLISASYLFSSENYKTAIDSLRV